MKKTAKTPAEQTLRYKHMVARLQNLPAYRQEAALVQEIAKGRQWRMDAAITAIETSSKSGWKWDDIDTTRLMELCGTYGRLSTLKRIVKLSKSEYNGYATAHGVLEAFDKAAMYGHYRTAAYLHAVCGASPDYLKKNNYPQRAMYSAMEEGDARKVAFLLDKGSAPGACIEKALHKKCDDKIIDLALSRIQPDTYVTSALVAAAERGREDVVNRILDRGAQVSTYGGNPLDFASKLSDATRARLAHAGAKPKI